MARKRSDPVERFLSKLSFDGDCIVFNGCGVGNRGNYRQFRLPDRYVKAHRFSYLTFVGEIPDDLQIDHICNNGSCVNPFHLELVTQKENMKRRSERQLFCKNGHPRDARHIYVTPAGIKSCRVCNTEATKRYKARRSGE